MNDRLALITLVVAAGTLGASIGTLRWTSRTLRAVRPLQTRLSGLAASVQAVSARTANLATAVHAVTDDVRRQSVQIALFGQFTPEWSEVCGHPNTNLDHPFSPMTSDDVINGIQMCCLREDDPRHGTKVDLRPPWADIPDEPAGDTTPTRGDLCCSVCLGKWQWRCELSSCDCHRAYDVVCPFCAAIPGGKCYGMSEDGEFDLDRTTGIPHNQRYHQAGTKCRFGCDTCRSQ